MLFGRGRVRKKEQQEHILIREAANVHADYVNVHQNVYWKTERMWLPVSLGKQSPFVYHSAIFLFGYTNKFAIQAAIVKTVHVLQPTNH